MRHTASAASPAPTTNGYRPRRWDTVSVSAVLAIAVNSDGHREVLGLDLITARVFRVTNADLVSSRMAYLAQAT